MSTKPESMQSPFAFESTDSTTSQARRLELTPALIERSASRASEVIRTASANPELHNLANAMLQGNPQDLINLIKAVHNDETIKADAQILAEADEDQLDRLLESRRSDRSKAKAKDISKNMVACRTYIGSMYAELMIRDITGKQYTGASTGTEYDVDELASDKAALDRKIKSLQTKMCRLKKTAPYVPADQKALEDVEAEIARLNQLRPNARVTAKTIVAAHNIDELRTVLSSMDATGMSEDEAAKLEQLMKMLG